MTEVRWLNLEYFFFKIHDFFSGIFGGSSIIDSTSSHQTFGQWLANFFTGTISFVWILATIAFIVLFCMVIYIKLRIQDLDHEHKKKHNDHFITPPPKELQPINPRWAAIEKLFASNNSSDWRVAIIDADTLLDETVTAMGFYGNNLGERLKNTNAREFPTLHNAWEAHKVRNRIAHEGASFNLTDHESNVTKKNFETVFHDMKII